MEGYRRTALVAYVALIAACSSHESPVRDFAADSKRTLALNESSERAELVRNGEQTPAALARLERKYDILAEVQALDGEAEARIIPIAYDPRELAAVKKVQKAFGDLYVAPTEGEELSLETMPWSGYWYPLGGTELFQGDASPFAKLDRLSLALGRPGGSAQWEADHHDRFPAAEWEGFCAAWSVASSLYPEPTRALSYKGETFSPSDLKAILTKVHERFPTEPFGIRYDGDVHTDGTYQDLRPEAFHRLVLRQLGEQRKPLLVDSDAGIAVWSKPLFRMRWVVRQDPEHENAFLVSAFPWFVRHRRAPSDAPTTDADLLSSVFEYRLYVDRDESVDGKFLVIAGEWLGRSLENHPDFAFIPNAEGAWGSTNSALTANFGVVQELLLQGVPH